MKINIQHENFKDNYVEQLLRARHITEIQKFLFPGEADIEPWGNLDNINAGISLITNLSATANVGLIVDADVDGYTSAAIIYQYLMRLYPRISIKYYIHKGKQHGLEDFIDEIKEEKFDLLIIPDAGSNDYEYLAQIDYPVLIIDHHEVEHIEQIPSNAVLVNNQSSPMYENKYMSGAGLVWQFCRGMDDVFGEIYAADYVDLAAVGVCGDMMSGLEIENQALWKYGFNHIKNFFLQTLIEKQSFSMNGEVTPMTVAFYVVPLMNAMIRMGTMEEKHRLFEALIDGQKLVESHKRGARGEYVPLATESVRECINAKAHQKKLVDQIMDSLSIKIEKYGLLDNKVLFIRLDDDDSFPPEINGLVAMQCVSKYKRPTIVARVNPEGYIKGSARGVNNSQLESFKDFLIDSNLFEYAQGHAQAFGISIKNKNLTDFHTYANAALKDYNFGETCYEADFIRTPYDSDLKTLIEEIYTYRDIWAVQNPEPLIYIKDINLPASSVQIIGKNKDTLKFSINGITYIKFFAKEMIEQVTQLGELHFEIIGKANVNEYMGTLTPQIMIENYEVRETKLTDF